MQTIQAVLKVKRCPINLKPYQMQTRTFNNKKHSYKTLLLLFTDSNDNLISHKFKCYCISFFQIICPVLFKGIYSLIYRKYFFFFVNYHNVSQPLEGSGIQKKNCSLCCSVVFTESEHSDFVLSMDWGRLNLNSTDIGP